MSKSESIASQSTRRNLVPSRGKAREQVTFSDTCFRSGAAVAVSSLEDDTLIDRENRVSYRSQYRGHNE